jgi:3-oxoacyl-(acyl-carrier-protein) synthase/acyl carrier protein
VKVSCGPPLGEQQVVIAEPETGARLDERHVGEVWVRGPSVAQGYWQRPEENARSFQARLADGDGPYLRTGDLGFLDEGELYITGRIKELIIIRGRNHYPQDIEQTVSVSHPALDAGAGAAFAVDADGEERLTVAHEVQRSHRRDLNVDEVAAAIRRNVSEHHGIDVHAVALLKPGGVPRTSSGKIQRAACRESFLAGTLDPLALWTAGGATRPMRTEPRSTPAVNAAPRSARTAAEIQSWLGQRLALRLHVSPDAIDHRADFKSFALDSQDAVGLSGELEEWLERRLSPTLLYDYVTIETLAAHLAGEDVSESASSTTRSPATAWPPHAEPIAIIGLGCRFPGGANDPASFWKLLRGGIDAIRETPAQRWDVDEFYDPNPAAPGKMSTRWGGFLDDVDKFDAAFFGIAPREAASMDPQQRMFLEVSWEALEHAGQAPDRLFGSQTGVFLGVCTSDYMHLLHAAGDRARIDAYYGTGSAFSVASGRLSYVLGLQGPNLPVDTACSSSLVAVHLAAQSLRAGECRMALAGGVNMLLSPESMIYFSKVHAMAADGRCKAFDAAADGYVRGEGCGVVVLKRLSDALADGDTVLALIRGSAINHDGRSNGLTAPNGVSQERVIRQALSVAGLEPGAIDYVETHGTGTALGDPIEARALTAALCEGRPADRPLMIGSVKTNIGHLEAAAGVAGLIKSVLALRQGEVPANLHFQRLNPHIAADEAVLSIPVEPVAWTRGERPRRAGVSSFGFGGTNAHVVIEEAPLALAPTSLIDRPLHMLTLSAKTPAALAELVRRYVDCLSVGNERIQDVCFTANVGRAQLPHRLTVVGESAAAIEDALWAHAAGHSAAGVQTGHAPRGARLKVALLFAGLGHEHVGLARELYDTQPVFRRAIDRCDALARPYLMSGGRGGSLV